MKRGSILLFLLVLLMSLTLGMNPSEASITFKDVPANSWYHPHVKYVTDDPRQLMVGYAGNFGPLDNLTVEQFVKICVAAAGRSVTVPKGQYWGDVYTPIGIELGFVVSGEFTDYKRPITRAEMARIIIRALPLVTGEKDVSYDLNAIKSRMIDYDSIPSNLRDDVCKAYQLGILVGGPDKRFNPNGSLTRASASAVIHNILDKTVRTPVIEEPSEMWSDAEFEAYMRSSDGTYVNINAIGRIEDRKIYWKRLTGQPALIPEATYPGINDTVYNLVKIMAYHTVKTKGYLECCYLPDTFGGIFVTDFYVYKTTSSHSPGNGDIGLEIYMAPTKSQTAEKYMPGQQKGLSTYMWELGKLCRSDNIINYESGMDRTKFVWTDAKYEVILKEMCKEVYGHNQGEAFYNYALSEMDKFFFSPNDYSASYIGKQPQMGIELVCYFPTQNRIHEFWTDRPVEKK